MQDMGLDTSKKVGQSNSETLISPPPHSCEEKLQRKVVGETTVETMSLLSASFEHCCPDSVLTGLNPVSDFSTIQYHVLAVDDSHFDRRVIERLLKTSSYKGQLSKYQITMHIRNVCT